MEHTSIIGSYASIFELSVALNFAYAASAPFRETMKAGFLKSIEQMDLWYSKQVTKTIDKIRLMSDEDINSEAKLSLKKKFENMLVQLREEDEQLTKETDEAQSDIVNQTKPLYIYTALFSLFILFLGGQEVAHNTFPIDGFNSIIYMSLFLIPTIAISSMIGSPMPVPAAVMLLLFSLLIGLFWPIAYIIPISNKHLLDIALLFSFLPFTLSVFRLTWLAFKLELKHRRGYYKAYKELAKAESAAKNLRESKNFFKQQE